MASRILAVAAAILTLSLAQTASAADMPTKAPVTPIGAPWIWNGFYLGINGGAGWGQSKQSAGLATSGGYTQNGGLVGGTMGYNWQISNWVLGFEADWDWANIDGDINTPACASSRCFTDLRSFGTARGRLGYAWDNWLIYATGGVAMANIWTGQDHCSSALICAARDGSGWTAGGGVETLVMPKWSVKVEYLYADFGDHVYYNPGTSVHAPERVNLVRAGVNFHF